MKLSRRGFLKVAGATGSLGLALHPTRSRGTEPTSAGGESAMLVDTTLCRGCRACEAACSESNDLPPPPTGDTVLDGRRATSTAQLTVVNRFDDPAHPSDPRFAKTQCMHCVSPACAAACPVRALEKLPSGPVVYHAERCMGCRYCMVACPFDVPKYEYEKALPRMRKCQFCAGRQAEGKAPACASVCPTGALTFGKRAELLDEAKRRIYQNPDRYQHRVYGEQEAGGTDWLYLADRPFEAVGLDRPVLSEAYPDLVKGALGVPSFVMTLWPPLLMGLYAFSRRRRDAVREAEPAEDSSEEGGGRG